MRTPERSIISRLGHQDGTTAVEYGVVSALVGLGLVATGPWLAGILVDLIDAITATML